MSIWRLIFGEIGHRKLNFVLGCMSVAIAAGCVVGAMAVLGGHDLRTEQVVEQREARTREDMTRLEDDYRKIMRRLGHNVLILHQDQDLVAMHAAGHPTTVFPQTYADELVRHDIQTLNHLLPILQQRVMWDELGEEVLLTGIRGQLAIGTAAQQRNPIMSPVPPGSLVLGATVARKLNVVAGETISFRGNSLRVDRVHPQRGNADDSTVWAELDQVQAWTGQSGMINGILALECVCESDSLGRISQEIGAILPDVQVLEFSSLVVARAEARKRAAEAHRIALEAERDHRISIRREHQRFASLLVPLVVAGAGVWIVILAFGNARDRRGEIGILRAIGYREILILKAFLLKAAVIGLVGGLVGVLGGLLVAATVAAPGFSVELVLRLVEPRLLIVTLAASPLLSCLASLLPSISAAGQDPAAVLRQE